MRVTNTDKADMLSSPEEISGVMCDKHGHEAGHRRTERPKDSASLSTSFCCAASFLETLPPTLSLMVGEQIMDWYNELEDGGDVRSAGETRLSAKSARPADVRHRLQTPYLSLSLRGETHWPKTMSPLPSRASPEAQLLELGVTTCELSGSWNDCAADSNGRPKRHPIPRFFCQWPHCTSHPAKIPQNLRIKYKGTSSTTTNTLESWASTMKASLEG